MEVVYLRGTGWHSGPVQSAKSFKERWRGLRGVPVEASVLMRTSSVHGIGLDRPFLAVGLTESFQVVGSRLVKPGHIVRIPGSRFILEIPEWQGPPGTGDQLELFRE